MKNYTHNDIIHAFRNTMLNAGMVTRHPIIDDGKLHRIHVEGDKQGTQNGAYILHNDGKPNGWFQHFSSGLTGRWSATGKREPFTKEMREQIEADRRQRELEQQQRHEQAALKAKSIVFKSIPAISYPYLTKKRIQPHNALIYNDALVIPIYAPTFEIVNLQFIDSSGNEKRFMFGGKKKGCFSIIAKKEFLNQLHNGGNLNFKDAPTTFVNNSQSHLEKILICEGWATGASLHEHTGHFVVCAMDAGNLEPVAREIKKLYPKSQIVICGDNDASGIGQLKAKAAAMAVFGQVLIPEQTGMDWNDVLTMEGK